MSESTNNMNVQNSELRPVIVKDVGSKTIEGSHAGDHRAPNTGATITDAFKNQSSPRGETNDSELEGA